MLCVHYHLVNGDPSILDFAFTQNFCYQRSVRSSSSGRTSSVKDLRIQHFCKEQFSYKKESLIGKVWYLMIAVADSVECGWRGGPSMWYVAELIPDS
ncbi:hypothetical protein SLA2020_003990 [Shorea laevis]